MSDDDNKDINGRNNELEKWLKIIENENIKKYIEIRLIPQMDYYSKSSRKYKKIYMLCKTIIIVFGALLPVATLFSDYGILAKVIITALGTSVSAITAYLELQNYHALWGNYRIKREQLLSILMYYFTDTGVFTNITNLNQKDAFLIEYCEQCLSEEHQIWSRMADKENDTELERDREKSS